MKKLLIAAAVALTLSGCAGTRIGDTLTSITDVVSSITITQSQVDALRSSYNATFLAPAANYRILPRCKTGETFIKNQCREPNIVRQLQAIDKTALRNFDNVQSMINTGNNTGLPAAWKVLQETVASARDFIAANGIGGM